MSVLLDTPPIGRPPPPASAEFVFILVRDDLENMLFLTLPDRR